MSENARLFGLLNAPGCANGGGYARAEKWLLPVLVYEQLVFMRDEAEEALARPGVVPCERALRKILEMADEIIPLQEKAVRPDDLEEAKEDIEAMRKRKKKQKALYNRR